LSEAAPGRAFAPALEAIVARALAKSPDARYQTALEFADALARLAGPVQAPRLSGEVEAPPWPADPPPASTGRIAQYHAEADVDVPSVAPRRWPWVVGFLAAAGAAVALYFALA
jgi:hypothetical protein